MKSSISLTAGLWLLCFSTFSIAQVKGLYLDKNCNQNQRTVYHIGSHIKQFKLQYLGGENCQSDYLVLGSEPYHFDYQIKEEKINISFFKNEIYTSTIEEFLKDKRVMLPDELKPVTHASINHVKISAQYEGTHNLPDHVQTISVDATFSTKADPELIDTGIKPWIQVTCKSNYKETPADYVLALKRLDRWEGSHSITGTRRIDNLEPVKSCKMDLYSDLDKSYGILLDSVSLLVKVDHI